VERLQRTVLPLMDPDHVLQRATHKELLLLQRRLALDHFVVRVKHLGDIL